MLVAKLHYTSKCPSISYVWGLNVIFSATSKDRTLIFCMKIPMIQEHLFFISFVRLSVGRVKKKYVQNISEYRFHNICILYLYSYYLYMVIELYSEHLLYNSTSLFVHPSSFASFFNVYLSFFGSGALPGKCWI